MLRHVNSAQNQFQRNAQWPPRLLQAWVLVHPSWNYLSYKKIEKHSALIHLLLVLQILDAVVSF